MKRIFVFALIICVVFLLIAGAQEKADNNEPAKTEPVKPITHLKVTLIDGINDKIFELKDCVVQIVGDLHMCDNVFPYQKTFIEGNDYEITIMIKPKD